MTETYPQPWQTVRRRLLYDGAPWLRLWTEDVRLPDGRILEGFYTVEERDASIIVALTPEQEVVVQHEYKHGARRVALHLPAGYVDPPEDPLKTAQRELAEETGYEADEWRHLGSFVNDGNRGAGASHYFLARGARLTGAPNPGEGEEMTVFLMPLRELARAALRGEIAVLSIATAIGLAVIATGE